MGGLQPDWLSPPIPKRILEVLLFPSSGCICCLWTGAALFIGLTDGWIGLSVTGPRPRRGFSADMVTPYIGSDRHPMQRVSQHNDIQDGERYTFISQSYKSKTPVPDFCSNPSPISRSHSKRAMSWSASNWPPFDKPILQEAKISSKYIWWLISWNQVPIFNSSKLSKLFTPFLLREVCPGFGIVGHLQAIRSWIGAVRTPKWTISPPPFPNNS